jgi:hypothetical protein
MLVQISFSTLTKYLFLFLVLGALSKEGAVHEQLPQKKR